MEKTKILVVIIILILVVLAGVTALYVVDKVQLDSAQKLLKAQQVNEKTLALTKLFVEKVLQGESEVNFEDRLKLENAVRDLNDKEIFDQWQKVVKSQTSQETQQAVGVFLNLLISKISY